MADDEDEESVGGLYEDGHWIWSDINGCLEYVSDLQQVEAIPLSVKTNTGIIEFRDDIDVIEQIRYRRRYQRKSIQGQADIISLQDVKDIAIYTAPLSLLSPMLINMLHLPTTERFIRALILWCGYYLQISDEMATRILELKTKVRTPDCQILEREYRDNLCDLRLLVAKEYGTMLMGGSDTKRFHHMGPHKKRRSLSFKDARLFETLLRMCVQIVWLALGRKSFNQIELEVNRLFKSEIFNAVEHSLKTGYVGKMSKEVRSILFGHCVRRDQKLNTLSPLMNEVFCARTIDYRMLGLGVIKAKNITSRLQYMLWAIAAPEENLKERGVVLGIIGLSKSGFDTMLKPLPILEVKSTKSMSSQSGVASRYTVSSAASTVKSKSTAGAKKLYPDIVLPKKGEDETFLPPTFPDEPEHIRKTSETQRRRWLSRLQRQRKPI